MEDFQQCAEFALFRNRGLGALAVTVLPIPLAGIADNLYRPGREDSRLSWLLAPHPLQVRAGYNQLIPLFVTMTDRELFHAGR